ncbi:MAG TPA: alkaline phosphatase family protein [Streptosporangiaceae bacterium]|nr:alkaline phosphatase family protein [Streptosporangiaceae bacterium]
MGEGPVNGTGIGRLWHRWRRPYTAVLAAGVLAAGGAIGATVASASTSSANTAGSVATPATVSSQAYRVFAPTATPIKHLVVIFDENVSFDHYFGTYPHAANSDGAPFHAKPGTPRVNGLSKSLLTSNPNSYNPQRLTPAQALTCDQNHGYQQEQEAFDGGKMDKFVQFTQTDNCTGEFGPPGIVMDYYDGNTVTGLWNYAQHYSMSDNNYDTNFGPSTPGALNVISGSDGDGYAVNPTTGAKEADAGSVSALNSQGLGTIYGDLDPAYDDCSDASHTSTSPVGVMTGRNIGDLLNARHISWGWFQGGFAPTSTNSAGYAVCGSSHQNVGGASVADYSPHHNPFEYYKSTANPKHLPPSSEAAIGRTDQANHEYDLSDFFTTLKDGNMPAVSYLKAAEYQDAHPGYSDPVDEQHFLVSTINQIEESPFWKSTAIVVTYDDSDGWYDHQDSPRVNGSSTSVDAAVCTSAPVRVGDTPDRCGYGPRLPLLVISPWTRDNYVSHNATDQSSVVSFIEDNWLHGQQIGGGSFDKIAGSLDAPGGVLDFHTRPQFRPLILDPTTGEVTHP